MIKNLLRIKIENVMLLISVISYISLLIYKYNNIITNEVALIRINQSLIFAPFIMLGAYKMIKDFRSELKNRY